MTRCVCCALLCSTFLLVLPCPGWFSLNVPSGLTLYWFVNNIISTAMQLYMRNTIKVDVPVLASDGAAPIIDVSSTVIKPKEDRSKQVRRLLRRREVGPAACVRRSFHSLCHPVVRAHVSVLSVRVQFG